MFVFQFVLIMLITYSMVSLFSRFFYKKNDTVAQDMGYKGQSFTAPTECRVARPINREIDFIDSKRSAKEVVTTVSTSWGTALFSSDGAVLQRLDISRELDGKASSITTIFPSAPDSKEDRCFLVAFDTATPYFYHLDRVSEDDAATVVIYTAAYGHGTIKKQFTVHKNKYQIDVSIAINAHKPLRARLLFPAPLMIDIQDKDTVTGFVLEGESIKRFEQSSIPLTMYWNQPTLFGVADRYFVNALVADEKSAIERAYFVSSIERRMLCCLESAEMVGETEYTWSLYVGPKDIDAMRAVNVRLEELVDYSGWFGPISIFMLKMLKFLHNYFHNFGVAIIVLTLLLRLLMLPLSSSGEKQRKQRAELDKKIKYIQQKYKDNPERINQERYELIRKQGFGGGLGCLMPLLQIPFFIGLNRLLSTSIELYKAPFVPGWISDLSSPDPLYILPLLFGIGMLMIAFQSDPSQRTTFLIVAVVSAFLFSSFAAGLVLFFVVSSFAGIFSTYIAKKLNWA